MATERQKTASLMLQAQGYSPKGAAAIVGNLSQESGNNLPTAFRTRDLDHGSNGLPQWRLQRLTDYEAYVRSLHPGASASVLWAFYGNMALQIAYIAIELKRDYPALDARLRSRTSKETIEELTEAVCWQYERPAEASANLPNRIAQAEATWSEGHVTGSEAVASARVAAKTEDAHSVAKKSTGFAAVLGTAAAGVAVHVHSVTSAPWWEWAGIAVLGSGAAVFVLTIIKAKSTAKTLAPPSVSAVK